MATIGREAILAGYTVLFIQATTLVAALAKAHADGRVQDKLTIGNLYCAFLAWRMAKREGPAA